MRGLPEGTVTLLFTDIEGSTRLLHEIGDLYGDVLAEHDRLLRSVWFAHGGVVVHTEGDAFFVAFPDADEAVKAAASAQLALDSHRWVHGGRLRVRMGMHTGSVRVKGDDYWGVDVHYAARLCAAASGGQVLLSASTHALVPDVLVDDLGEHALKDFAAPRKLFHLRLAGARAEDFPPLKTLLRARTNLPSSPNRLIGRERELGELRAALTGEVRLMTISGVGGSGKTRLALACGTDLLDAFRDGVFLVRLAAIEQPEAVAFAIADAVGAAAEDGRDPEAAILAYLARREMLLVVDNMEHVLGAAPLLSRMLEAVPGVRILVTSQAPLRLTLEAVMALAPLDLPQTATADIDDLERAPATALFLERARAADGSFALAPGDLKPVAELCRRLDGLPLALELAAARVRIGGPARLLSALERGIEALGSGARDLPDRQRGLRAALGYTVSLLDEEPRQLLAAVGVFAGAWTIEQTETMFGDDLDVWEATASLLDFALVRTRGDGRLAMAEPIRAYARTLLIEQGRDDECRRRHALMLVQEAEAIDDEFLFNTPALTARTIELEDEYSAAIRWTSANDLSLHRRLVGALGAPYYLSNRIMTIARDISDELARGHHDDAITARLHVARAMVLTNEDDVEGAVASLDQAAACRRGLGDQAGEAIVAAIQAQLLNQHMVDDERAPSLVQAALLLPQVAEDHQLRSLLKGELALSFFQRGRLEEADAILSEIVGDPRLEGSFIAMIAGECWGDCAAARGQFDVALERYAGFVLQTRGMPLNGLLSCIGIVGALVGLRQDLAAIELYAGLTAAFERDLAAWVFELLEWTSDYEAELLAEARARVGETAASDARDRGRAREREELIDWALALAHEHAAKVSGVAS